jgi:hypothetical protein
MALMSSKCKYLEHYTEENSLFSDCGRDFTCVQSMARCMFTAEAGECGHMATVAAFHFQ